MNIKTNNQARELIAEKGITTENVTRKQLMELHDKLGARLEASECFGGSFEMNPMDVDEENMKFMTCKSDYFEDREAASFNSDGFIGFAGWASSQNTKPILDAVSDWLQDY